MRPAADLINIPVNYFALPVPRTGSIEPRSGYDRSTLDGQEIHLRVQKKRSQSDPLYQAEVPVSRLFERGGTGSRSTGAWTGFSGSKPR